MNNQADLGMLHGGIEFDMLNCGAELGMIWMVKMS